MHESSGVPAHRLFVENLQRFCTDRQIIGTNSAFGGRLVAGDSLRPQAGKEPGGLGRLLSQDSHRSVLARLAVE